MKIIGAIVSWLMDLPFSFYHYVVKQLVRQNLQQRGIHMSSSCLVQGSRFITCRGRVSAGSFGVFWCGNDPTGSLIEARLEFGTNVCIGDHFNIRAAGAPIKVGNDVLIANNVTIVSSNHGFLKGIPIVQQPWVSRQNGVRIGDDVWIGANAVILPGAEISDGAIVAAGAVVRSYIPANEIWGGVPARKIGSR